MIGRKVKYENRNQVQCVDIVLDKVISSAKRTTQAVDNGKVFEIKISLVIDHYVIRPEFGGEIDLVECIDVLEVL